MRQLENLINETDPINVTPRMGYAFEGVVEEVEEVEQEETVGESWAIKALVTISTGRVASTYDSGAQYDEGYPYG